MQRGMHCWNYVFICHFFLIFCIYIYTYDHIYHVWVKQWSHTKIAMVFYQAIFAFCMFSTIKLALHSFNQTMSGFFKAINGLYQISTDSIRPVLHIAGGDIPSQKYYCRTINLFIYCHIFHRSKSGFLIKLRLYQDHHS